MVNAVRHLLVLFRGLSSALCFSPQDMASAIRPEHAISFAQTIGHGDDIKDSSQDPRRSCTAVSSMVATPSTKFLAVQVHIRIVQADGLTSSTLVKSTRAATVVLTDIIYLVTPMAPVLICRPIFPAFVAAATSTGDAVNAKRLDDFHSPFKPSFVYHIQSVERNIHTQLHPSVRREYDCHVILGVRRICLGVGEPLYWDGEYVVFAVYGYDSGSESRDNDRGGGMLVVPARHVWLGPDEYLPIHLRTASWFFNFHWHRIPLERHENVRLTFDRPIAPADALAVWYPSPRILTTSRRREDEYGWSA